MSSCFWDEGALTPLREDTRRIFERNGLSLWTWEHWDDSGGLETLAFRYAPYPAPSFAQIAIFRTALVNSRVVIVFVSKRRGSEIRPWPYTLVTNGTYFEIEIFFAVALGKPIILFREAGERLDEPLEQLLRVAQKSGAIQHEEQISRSELPQKSVEAYQAVARRMRSPLKRFTTFLAQRREPEIDFQRVSPFLFGAALPRTKGYADLDAFDQLLASEQQPDLPLSERMSRLWLALQELLPFRSDVVLKPGLAFRWQAGLDAWSSAASWFGLHSHLVVSPLVAQAERARLAIALPELKLAIPYGPLASARYSMARRQMIGRRRQREMGKVIEEAQLAVNSRTGDVAGYRSIIGFALLQKLHPRQSVEQFSESLSLRLLEGEEGRIGEGKADLGLALFLSGHIARGIPILKEGVDLLERSDRSGAYVRAMKKLELVYRLTGQWKRAGEIREKRTSRAVSEEIFDQL